MVTDSEYLDRRKVLQQEQLRAAQEVAVDENRGPWFEPLGDLISFSNRAAEWFLHGDDLSRRIILESVSSNLVLKDKILRIEAKVPLSTTSELSVSTRQLGAIDNVRTSKTRSHVRKVLRKIRDELDAPECKDLLANIRKLREHFEPEALAQADAERPRMVRAASRAYRASGDGGSYPQPQQA
jgi:hypothetical protein